jgi:hypothetical protein
LAELKVLKKSIFPDCWNKRKSMKDFLLESGAGKLSEEEKTKLEAMQFEVDPTPLEDDD